MLPAGLYQTSCTSLCLRSCLGDTVLTRRVSVLLPCGVWVPLPLCMCGFLCVQLVGFIAAMEALARDSPGAFSGYKLKVQSHSPLHSQSLSTSLGFPRHPPFDSQVVLFLAPGDSSCVWRGMRRWGLLISPPTCGAQVSVSGTEVVSLRVCAQVVESHQSTKVDTSGTAKDVVSIFQRLGMDFSFDQVRTTPQT